MARLQFYDYHNMVAILEKGEFNTDFHPMVDFITASPFRYALTVKPTIFVSHIRQFWSTAWIETTDEGTYILATVDGIQRTISESSLRHNLRLRDEDGIVFILGEAAAERINNDSEDIARVLTSMDAATVLAGGIDVPTGSGSIPTAGPPATVIYTGSEVGPTASPIVGTTLLPLIQEERAKKELEEQQEKEDMRMNKQIARDAEVARIHAEEELQGMIDSLDKSNETIAKYLQEYQEFASELPLEKRIELIRWKVKDFKGLSIKEIEAKFAEVWKQVGDFILMGSKEEAERIKRKGLNLEQEHVKKQKSSEQAPEMEKSTEEITKEKMKERMQLVPVEDVYVQALQVKHPIIDCNIHTEGQRSYWKIIRLGGSSACYQFFIDLLKQLDREDLNQLWDLVKEYLNIRPAKVEIIRSKWSASCDCQRQIDLHASRKRLSSQKRRIEMPLPQVCTAIEEKKKKLPVKDRWQLH
nr:hypothetical protein [Tanacetum cinerariifolium]